MTRDAVTLVAILAALWTASCGPTVHAPAVPASATRLAAPIGHVVAIDDIGDTTVVLDEHRAFVLRGGQLSATAESPHGWRAGAAIAAPDGDGRWALGVDDRGQLWRITITGELENVTERFGLARTPIAMLAATGATTAFVLGDRADLAASADGLHLVRASLPAPASSVAAAPGRVAMLEGTGEHAGVEVWDLARNETRRYPVAGARALAFADGHLAVATDRTLYVERDGDLRRISTTAPIRALAASGTRLWLLADHLYALDGTSLRRADIAVAADAALFPAPGGDAWLASSHGLVRTSLEHGIEDPAWQAQVAPVFQRVCAHCHLPGGDAGIDLSTAAAWRAERSEIERRVMVTRTMPPAGTELSEADRAALATWLK